MRRLITQHEMDRRKAMSRASSDVVDAIAKHSLTSLEWAGVLNELQQLVIKYGLAEEWEEEPGNDGR